MNYKASEKNLPRPGDRLTHHFRKNLGDIIAEVVTVDTVTEKVVVKVGDTTYPSLSAAAQAISGYPTNGWIFWGLKKMAWRPRS